LKNKMNLEEVAIQHDTDSIESLINDLGSGDGMVRVRAREALVTIGGRSVNALSDVLKSKNEGQRWEAAKAFSCTLTAYFYRAF
jgi:HEAT repeat protein